MLQMLEWESGLEPETWADSCLDSRDPGPWVGPVPVPAAWVGIMPEEMRVENPAVQPQGSVGRSLVEA